MSSGLSLLDSSSRTILLGSAKAVVTLLGFTKLTLILYALNSACQDCVIPFTANFEDA